MKRFAQFREMLAGENRKYITPPRGILLMTHLVAVALLTVILSFFGSVLVILSVFLCLPLTYWIYRSYRLWKIYYARAFFFPILLLDFGAACLLSYFLKVCIFSAVGR